MSTHAAIIQKTPRGYKSIYVHFDGYPAGAGQTLRQYYRNNKIVSELIDCGDIPSVRATPKLTLKHKIDYDESEFNKPAIVRNTIKEILNELNGVAPYIYCFDGKNWKMRNLVK